MFIVQMPTCPEIKNEVVVAEWIARLVSVRESPIQTPASYLC